jgi:nicotinamidase-related amidase
MNAKELLRLRRELFDELWYQADTYRITKGVKVGLVIIDEVNGFCRPGFGYFAPPEVDADVERMILGTNTMAKAFAEQMKPIFVFRENHLPGFLEQPYPAHCEEGTGEELLVEELRWLENEITATVYTKNCLNGFIAAYDQRGKNRFVDWINENQIEAVIVVGICTDICVMQFVLTLLAARNVVYADKTQMMPTLKDVVVWANACATYDLPMEVVKQNGWPKNTSHPRALMDDIAYYLMQKSGAIIVWNVPVPEE